MTAALVSFLDVFMKPNGNGQSTINNMNDNERKYMKLSDLTESFVLWKGCDSLDFTWTLDSLWPDAVRREFYAPDNSWNIYLQKQGVVRLTVEVAGRTRYYDAVVNIPPYVGSAENPFLISNLEDFLAFRNGINANEDFVYHRFLIPHDSLPHIHWIQTADIDLASAGDWIPIGKNADTCFTGFYDGRGHKLMNLTMTDGTDRALFIYSKGDIKNLVIEDPHITGCGGSSAALATNVKGGSFENCAVTYSTQALSTSTTQPLPLRRRHPRPHGRRQSPVRKIAHPQPLYRKPHPLLAGVAFCFHPHKGRKAPKTFFTKKENRTKLSLQRKIFLIFFL